MPLLPQDRAGTMLFSHGLHRTRPNNVPDIIIEEGSSQTKTAESPTGYDGFVATLRENLAKMTDGHGKALYTAQQIDSQLEDS